MDYTLEAWQAKIRESLDAGCPVIYAANNAGTGDTRHMFVVDGYTDNGYFHFNFGWAGSGNGWFKLDAIKPYQGDDYSWQEGSEHYAIFNFAPHKVLCAVSVASSSAAAGMVSVDGSMPEAAITCDRYDCNNMKLTALPADGYAFSHWSKGDETVSTAKECTVKVIKGDSDYIAKFVEISATETVALAVEYNSNYGTVECDGEAVGVVNDFYKNSEVTLVATPKDGCLFSGWVVNGVEYTTNSVTFLLAEDMTVVAEFVLPVADYVIDNTTGTKLTTEKISRWEYTPTENNPLALTLTGSENAIAFNASNRVVRLYTGKAGVQYAITVPEGYVIDKYCFTKARMSSPDNNIRVIADVEYLITTTAQDIVVEGVNAAVAEFTIAGEADKSLQFASIVVTVKKYIPGDTTSIHEVKGENGKLITENGELRGIYDLSGRRLDRITAPGIYIVNGKKVLVTPKLRQYEQ
jgi:hypothetical protein